MIEVFNIKSTKPAVMIQRKLKSAEKKNIQTANFSQIFYVCMFQYFAGKYMKCCHKTRINVIKFISSVSLLK